MQRSWSLVLALVFLGFCGPPKPSPLVSGLLIPPATPAAVVPPVEIVQGTLVAVASGTETNEFGNRVRLSVRLGKAPTTSLLVCLVTSNEFAGTVVVTSPVSASAAPCNSPFLTFTPENWETNQTVSIQGERGVVGVSGDTTYFIDLRIISTEDAFKNVAASRLTLINRNIDVAGATFIRVNIINLNGTLVLQNNTANNLTFTESGINNFTQPLSNGSTYSISVLTQPTGQNCAAQESAFGTVTGTTVTINFNCVTGFVFNGTIFGTANPPTLGQSFASLTTLAGTASSGNVNGIGTVARFNNPIALATDGSNLFVADLGNNAVRRMSLGNNQVTTLATVNGAHGVATDGTNVYVSSFNRHTITKVVIATGATSIIGGLDGTSGNTNGASGTSRFNTPTYLTTDGVNLYITDRGNNTIRRIVLATGAATSALSIGLNSPNGIATDGRYLYIANSGVHTILRFDLQGSSSTATIIAGANGTSGTTDNATGTTARFNSPYGLALDGTYLYVLEGAGQRLRRVTLSGNFPVSTISIAPASTGLLDGALGTPPGLATARFCNNAACDTSITTDGNFLYLADRNLNTIRRFGY